MASSGATISSAGGAAERYAAALYSLAEDRQRLDRIIRQTQSLGELIDGSEDLRRLLGSPLIDTATARKTLSALLAEPKFGKIMRNFVGVVATNRRLNMLRAIVRAFAALVDEKRGVIAATVATAHALTDLQRQQLRARLIEAGYGSVNLLEKTDPTLLGGMVVTIGARIYDTSLNSRLQRLRYAMKGAA